LSRIDAGQLLLEIRQHLGGTLFNGNYGSSKRERRPSDTTTFISLRTEDLTIRGKMLQKMG
jgi:hypothetical protein